MADKQKSIEKVRYTLDGASADLSLSDITLGERIQMEDFLEMPYSIAISSRWFVSEKTQAFLAFLALRRRDENLTLDKVLEAKKLEVEFDPKERPTGKASKRTRAASGGQPS